MKISKKGKQMSDDSLENITGGYWATDPGFFHEYRFLFDDQEVQKIREKTGKIVRSIHTYTRGELNDILGYNCENGEQMMEKLSENFGFTNYGWYRYGEKRFNEKV